MVNLLKGVFIPVQWLVPAARMLRQMVGVRPDFRETIYQLEHFGIKVFSLSLPLVVQWVVSLPFTHRPMFQIIAQVNLPAGL